MIIDVLFLSKRKLILTDYNYKNDVTYVTVVSLLIVNTMCILII
jgi:hypothetical protein